eukprot:EG_transcript_61988
MPLLLTPEQHTRRTVTILRLQKINTDRPGCDTFRVDVEAAGCPGGCAGVQSQGRMWGGVVGGMLWVLNNLLEFGTALFLKKSVKRISLLKAGRRLGGFGWLKKR